MGYVVGQADSFSGGGTAFWCELLGGRLAGGLSPRDRVVAAEAGCWERGARLFRRGAGPFDGGAVLERRV